MTGQWSEFEFEDLPNTGPQATPDDVRNRLLADMGEDVPPARRPRPGPDVSGLARDIGVNDD